MTLQAGKHLGPGGTLDLTGHDGSAPILITTDPVSIYADIILLDSGVDLTQLFDPPPNESAGQNIEACSIEVVDYSCELGGGVAVPGCGFRLGTPLKADSPDSDEI